MAEYFSHDYHARNDLKIVKMRADLGLTSLGAYWCLIEILYEQNGFIKTKDLSTIAKVIDCPIDILLKIVNDYDLFIVKNDIIENNSINKRLKVRQEKSEKASSSAKVRWSKSINKSSVNDIDAISNATSNAISITDSNAINNKKKRKNRKNNTISELFSCQDILLFDEIWMSNAAKSLSIDKSRIEDLMKKFSTHLLTIKKEHNNVSEFASHFLNWCRISKNDNNSSKIGQINSSTPVN